MLQCRKICPVRTSMTISAGLTGVYFLTGWTWSIIFSLLIAVSGAFSPFIAAKVDFLWMKFSALLSLIIPNILLCLIYFIILFPVSVLHRFFTGDTLNLKDKDDSTFEVRDKEFNKSSLEKIW